MGSRLVGAQAGLGARASRRCLAREKVYILRARCREKPSRSLSTIGAPAARACTLARLAQVLTADAAAPGDEFAKARRRQAMQCRKRAGHHSARQPLCPTPELAAATSRAHHVRLLPALLLHRRTRCMPRRLRPTPGDTPTAACTPTRTHDSALTRTRAPLAASTCCSLPPRASPRSSRARRGSRSGARGTWWASRSA